MNHDNLSRLGEELLQEFDAEKTVIPAEFDQKCRNMLQPKKKLTAWQVVRWASRAAVLVFALIGMMTVTVLSINPLRSHVLQLAAECEMPEEEEWSEYQQISYAQTGNAAMSMYYDGKSSYQILWANEYGKRLYDFSSYSADETFFHDLSAQLNAMEE